MLTKDRVDAKVGLSKPVRVCISKDGPFLQKKALSYLEDIKSGNSVNIGLLVSSVDLGSLFVNGRKERGQEFELKTLYRTDDVESKLN